uniref:Protein transport protein SEC23 n=1 Tax=Spongospora subterranea TaxID=70186 RepID=A0A0H5R5Y7_9EUKA|eukprot:CRZ09187.1 hypothetical protein [Spongospora subterranea]
MSAATELEAKDGLRLSWMRWPSTRVEASRVVVPLAAMYTPLMPPSDPNFSNQVQYDPVKCSGKGCNALLNLYCEIDYNNRIWVCQFCLSRNMLPQHYSDIGPYNLPAELMQEYTTIDYLLPYEPPVLGPYILFVIDTCTIELELDKLRSAIISSLSTLPANTLVGLITFGKHVSVHELEFNECPKSFVFRGNPKNDNVTTVFVADMLGLAPPIPAANKNAPPPSSPQNSAKSKSVFFLPVESCIASMATILNDLIPDPWPVKGDERPARATGVAASVAVGLLEAVAAGCNARIMFFSAGAASAGPGKIVSMELSETIRSHHDLFKGNCQWHDKACKYYSGLADRLATSGHVFDLFACSLDQIGLAEMKVLVDKSGGLLVLSDMFRYNTDSKSDVFAQSFQMCFVQGADGYMNMAFQGEIEVITSRESKVSGAIGHLSSKNQKGTSVCDKEIGIGNTNLWRVGGLTSASSYAFYFDVVNTVSTAQTTFLQFITKYRDAGGFAHVKCTTCVIPLTDSSTDSGLAQVAYEFDQETAAVVVARLAIFKAENEFTTDVLRWLDRMLIRLMAKFSSYTKDQPDSFQMSPQQQFYPQFMFHLRRSQFLQVTNSSPDETAFYRQIFLNENVANSLTMIQPVLLAYDLCDPSQSPTGASCVVNAVLLDAGSVGPERILVLDTFFNVILWHGESVAQWKNDGLDQDPNYLYLKEFFSMASDDANSFMTSRFPAPLFRECSSGDSQSRFLLAKLNPSVTQNTVQGYGAQGGPPPVFTDDVSLKVFMDHLRKLAVQN